MQDAMTNPPNLLLANISSFVVELFQNRLPEHYCFHNIQHTIEVVEMAAQIGQASGLDEGQMEIVAIAAWFHDTGYTEQYKGHEDISMRIAGDYLHHIGYPTDKIRRVQSCINATNIPHEPHNLMEQVLCDADVANIGTETFVAKTEALRHEQEISFDRHFSHDEWYRMSIKFCRQHQFHTDYARRIFSNQLAANIALMEQSL